MVAVMLFILFGGIFAAAMRARTRSGRYTKAASRIGFAASLAFAVTLCAAVTVPGCSVPYNDITCAVGATLWRCSYTLFYSCGCSTRPPVDVWWGGCGSSAVSAASDGLSRLSQRLNSFGLLVDGVVRNGSNTTIATHPETCIDTGSTGCGTGQTTTPCPPYTTQSLCDPATGDDGCLSCAKSSCCNEYMGCAGDANCICWVDCEAAGNAPDVCGMAQNCGPLDAVSTATQACLIDNCGSQCPMGAMAANCSCSSTTSNSSSGGGGGASCAPGPFGPGESCLSDADCVSCVCNDDFCN